MSSSPDEWRQQRYAAALSRKNEISCSNSVMDVDRIITIASRGVRIQFLAFERSLRAPSAAISPCW